MLTTDVLNISPEIITLLIEKLKEFYAKEEVTFDESISNSEYEYDWSQILADHGDDQTYIEIKNVINDLEPDQQVDLLTLIFIGSDDFDSSQWSEARKEAKSSSALQHLSEYLLSKPFVAEYLASGLESLGYSFDNE